jgi:hypothetical protein
VQGVERDQVTSQAEFGAVATRYGKTDTNFPATVPCVQPLA